MVSTRSAKEATVQQDSEPEASDYASETSADGVDELDWYLEAEYDDEDPHGSFRGACIRNMFRFLRTRKRMSTAAAKDFLSKRVTIMDVNAVYDDETIRTAGVTTKIAAARGSGEARSDAAHIQLQFDYHHRPRSYETEHSVSLSYRMPGGSGNVFKSNHQDVQVKSPKLHQIERRTFSLSQTDTKNVQQTIFGDDWTALQALLMCYAAVGVGYKDAHHHVPSEAEYPCIKDGWLEYHTKEACKALTTLDDGYETEPFEDRYDAEVA